ncbi:hypothetical protein TWF751_005101 [Orbilia oligospora]|nr:hypothetical protein TWF751_005101 [Orbilia oligospora]
MLRTRRLLIINPWSAREETLSNSMLTATCQPSEMDKFSSIGRKEHPQNMQSINRKRLFNSDNFDTNKTVSKSPAQLTSAYSAASTMSWSSAMPKQGQKNPDCTAIVQYINH